jgi:hypothetical protein
LDILGLDGDTLGVDGAKVSVFEERHEICLDRLLKGTNSRRLEAEIRLEILSNFTDKTLERQLADQEFSRFLIATDLTESDSSRLIAMGLLDTTSRRCRLPSSLRGELFTRGLATSGLAYKVMLVIMKRIVSRIHCASHDAGAWRLLRH